MRYYELTTIVALLTLAIGTLSGCGTPGLNESVSSATLAGFRSFVVVSVVADKIEYHQQGFIASDVAEVRTADWGIDPLVAERVANAVQARTGVPSTPYRDVPSPQLYAINRVHALSKAIGPDFDAAKPQLRQIIQSSGAGTAVLVLKGRMPLPGALQYSVLGPTVSRMYGTCGYLPASMIAILDPIKLEPIVATYVSPSIQNPPRPQSSSFLPEPLCEKKLQLLTAEEQQILRRSALSHFAPAELLASVGRLVAR